MKIELTPVLSAEKQALLNQLAEKISAAEYSDLLTQMLEVYIQHAEVDRLTMANTVSKINMLIGAAYQLEHLNKLNYSKASLIDVMEQRTPQQLCSHN